MPGFGVRFLRQQESPAAAPMLAYQQTQALLGDLEAQSQAMDLREMEMGLSALKAAEFKQNSEQARALDQADFDATQAWNAVKSRQAAHEAWSEQGHLAQFWDPDDRQALEGMDASEPGYWDLFNQGTIRAQQGYAQAQLRGMLDEAKALGIDEQVQGYLEAGDAEGARAAVKDARQAATRKGALTNWTASVAAPYKSAMDEMIRTGAIPPEQQLEANMLLAEINQYGAQDIREGTLQDMEDRLNRLAVILAPPRVASQMQQLQQQNEMLTARLAGATTATQPEQPPAPRKVPTFDQATDDTAKELMTVTDELRALEEELARREQATVPTSDIPGVSDEAVQEEASGKIKWRGSRNLQ